MEHLDQSWRCKSEAMRCLTDGRLSTFYLTKSLWCLMKHGTCVWLCCSLSLKVSEMSFDMGFLVFLCPSLLRLFVCLFVFQWRCGAGQGSCYLNLSAPQELEEELNLQYASKFQPPHFASYCQSALQDTFSNLSLLLPVIFPLLLSELSITPVAWSSQVLTSCNYQKSTVIMIIYTTVQAETAFLCCVKSY